MYTIWECRPTWATETVRPGELYLRTFPRRAAEGDLPPSDDATRRADASAAVRGWRQCGTETVLIESATVNSKQKLSWRVIFRRYSLSSANDSGVSGRYQCHVGDTGVSR